MASPDFWMGMDAAQEKKFAGGASADEDYARSLRSDASQQIWDFGVGESKIAVGAKGSKSPVIIEKKDTSGGGPEAVQKRRVTGLTLERLHCGLLTQQPTTRKLYPARSGEEFSP
jgi:hypothetical protein